MRFQQERHWKCVEVYRQRKEIAALYVLSRDHFCSFSRFFAFVLQRNARRFSRVVQHNPEIQNAWRKGEAKLHAIDRTSAAALAAAAAARASAAVALAAVAAAALAAVSALAAFAAVVCGAVSLAAAAAAFFAAAAAFVATAVAGAAAVDVINAAAAGGVVLLPVPSLSCCLLLLLMLLLQQCICRRGERTSGSDHRSRAEVDRAACTPQTLNPKFCSSVHSFV